jgi:flagellar assembly factor FliW
VDLAPIANKVGLGTDTEDWAVMAVLAAPKGQPATVNLLAPVIVNVATRVGAQLFLEGSSYTTRELFVMRPRADEPGEENQTLEKAAAG